MRKPCCRSFTRPASTPKPRPVRTDIPPACCRSFTRPSQATLRKGRA